jgi:hypothetical protein
MQPSAETGGTGFGPAADAVGFGSAADGAGDFGAASAMQSGFASAGGIGFGPAADAVGFGSAADGAVGFGAASAMQSGFATAGGGGFQTGHGVDISLANPANVEMLKRQQAWLFGDADEPDADAGAAGAGARQAAKPAFQTAADKVLTGRPGRAAASRPAPPVAPPARGAASGRGARHGLSRSSTGSVSKASSGFKAPGQVGEGPRVAEAAAPPRHPTPAAKKGRFSAPRQGRPVLAAAAAPPRPSPMGNRAALPPAAAAAATRPAGPVYCACASTTPFGERQCPSCCNHCGGRVEKEAWQMMHGVGCPNDGCGLIVA